MTEDYNKYIKELHESKYTIFGSKSTEDKYLSELHDSSYMIFDQLGIENLKQEFESEFSRMSNSISFVSVNNMTHQDVDLIIVKGKKENGDNALPKLYIIKDNSIIASGYYYVSTKKFVLKAGSFLSLKVDPTYLYSVRGRIRRRFIQNNCFYNNKGHKLKRDSLFGSPNEAASYVLGRETNGLYEWRTKDGTRLIELINPEDIQKKN